MPVCTQSGRDVLEVTATIRCQGQWRRTGRRVADENCSTGPRAVLIVPLWTIRFAPKSPERHEACPDA